MSDTQVRKDYTTEDAIKQGQDDAKRNLKASEVKATVRDEATREEVIESAQKLAELNHEKEQEANEALKVDSNELKNDTTKAAKVRTATSQLDPDGTDPISKADIERSATDANMETGNNTAVSDEEASERAYAEPSKSAPVEVPVEEEPSPIAQTEAEISANEESNTEEEVTSEGEDQE